MLQVELEDGRLRWRCEVDQQELAVDIDQPLLSDEVREFVVEHFPHRMSTALHGV